MLELACTCSEMDMPRDNAHAVQDMHERDLEGMWTAFGADDSKIYFINKLYRLKMEHLLRSSNTTVLRCTCCGGLFSAAHISHLRCMAGYSFFVTCLAGTVD